MSLSIYSLPDNIIFPCMYVVVVGITPLPDNFDRDNLYHGSTPRPSRSTKTLEDTQTLEKNNVGLLPPPTAPLPDKLSRGHPNLPS